MQNKNTEITWEDFEKVDMRVGTIIETEEFKEAKNKAYKIIVDFGEFGIKKSSAQITKLYSSNELIGKQIIAVVNFPPKQIANTISECLILGVLGNDKEVTLIHPVRKTQNGLKIG